jgi:hypothetical protein
MRMNLRTTLSELRSERQRLDRAISALEALDGTGANEKAPRTSQPVTRKPSKRRRMSAAGRKRISDMMKARWAARRKAAGRKA